MTINISLQDVGDNLHPKITVLGVGGSGGNAVNNMINANLEGVDFLIANTDAQALQISECPNKIQLGLNSTRGLGAGMRPDIGKQAAEEAIQEITEKLDGNKLRLKSFNIFQFLPVNKESFFLNGSNVLGVKL